MRSRNIESRLTAAENNRRTNAIPHCLHFRINSKDLGYVVEVLRYDCFCKESTLGDIKGDHYICREVEHFKSLQDAADYMDDYYWTYKKTYGVPCTAQVLGINFRPSEKQIRILQSMSKHLLLIGDAKEIKP